MLSAPVDLLLLNNSNLPRIPLFPYAFVQVSALARAANLNVRRFDFLGVPPESRRSVLEKLLRETSPRMVGVHLRNIDSLIDLEYAFPGNPTRYLPAEDTRELIELIRQVTEAPIVVGGFGFTTHATRMMEFLKPDFGIQGEPDGFFRRFEDVLARRDLGSVPNLLFKDASGVVGPPRTYFDPPTHREYNDEIVSELKAFYGANALPRQTIAIEIGRGCPFRCYFCTEPLVKGRKYRWRDLDLVFSEVEYLLSQNLSRFFFVCSEMNIEGDELPLQLAERVAKLNEGRRDRPIMWTAYNLPTMTNIDVLRTLVRSGYSYSWNEAQSLEDSNLKDTGVPYRSRHVMQYVQNIIQLEAEASREAPVPGTFPNRLLTLFLGNAFATPATISQTLKAVSDSRIGEHFDGALLVQATRVFDTADGYNCGAPDSVVTFPAERASDSENLPDLVRPTFQYPNQLVAALGSVHTMQDFFGYIGDTLLSRRFQRTRAWTLELVKHASTDRLMQVLEEAPVDRATMDWSTFEAELAPPPAPPPDATIMPDFLATRAVFVPPLATRLFRGAVGAPPSRHAIDELLNPPPSFAQMYDIVAGVVAKYLLMSYGARLVPVLRHLGIACTNAGPVPATEYEIMKPLYERYASVDALVVDVRATLKLADGALELFLLRLFLHAHNVRIEPKFKSLLYS